MMEMGFLTNSIHFSWGNPGIYPLIMNYSVISLIDKEDKVVI